MAPLWDPEHPLRVGLCFTERVWWCWCWSVCVALRIGVFSRRYPEISLLSNVPDVWNSVECARPSGLKNCNWSGKQRFNLKYGYTFFYGIGATTSGCVTLVWACVCRVQAMGKNCKHQLCLSEFAHCAFEPRLISPSVLTAFSQVYILPFAG